MLLSKLNKLKQRAVNLSNTIVDTDESRKLGNGASDLCEALGIRVSKWDIKQTVKGGPFPEILDHDIFLLIIYYQNKSNH